MEENAYIQISLNELEAGLPGINKIWGAFLCDASKACFDNQNHISSVKLLLQGISTAECKVMWAGEIDEQSRRTWNDTQEMTEYGACGVAILLILKLTEYTVIERSKKGTGFDYWLGSKNSELPFQNSARLEVSGILRGDRSTFNSRVNQKLKQTFPTDNTKLPAYVIVVEFSEPKAKTVMK
jgi:hypothetical protein